MKITKVQYGKTYSLGNYCSERIDLEASIDESEQDHIPMIVEILKGKCDSIHKANNPGLYIERTTYVPDTNVGNIPQQPEPQPPKKTTIETYIIEIQSVNDPEKLKKEWALLAKSNPKLKDAYELQLKKLTV